jgi:hypothetical protein
MKISKAYWMLLTSVLLFTASQLSAQCWNGTIRGSYAFTLTGQILAPAMAAGPVSGVAVTEFDGAGDLKQVDHVVHNGVLPVEDWRPAVGSYSINSDCTGWMTIDAQPTVAADASPELKLYIVVAKDGSEIHTVVSGSPTVPPFTASITSVGVRTDRREP